VLSSAEPGRTPCQPHLDFEVLRRVVPPDDQRQLALVLGVVLCQRAGEAWVLILLLVMPEVGNREAEAVIGRQQQREMRS
jgi:hypothetical protein